MKKGLLLAIFVGVGLCHSLVFAMSCDDAVAGGANAKGAKQKKLEQRASEIEFDRNILSPEIAALRTALQALRNGSREASPNLITPKNRRITFAQEKANGSKVMLAGRILGGRLEEGTGWTLLFEPDDELTPDKTNNRGLLPVSEIALNTLNLKLYVNPEDRLNTIERLNKAQIHQHLIEFAYQEFGLKVVRGVVSQLVTDGKQGANVTQFRISGLGGTFKSYEIAKVDPTSIKNVEPIEPKLTRTQKRLVNSIFNAIEEKKYVTFTYSDPEFGKVDFEGWITGTEVDPYGKVKILLDEIQFIPEKGSKVISLDQVVETTFRLNPSVAVDTGQITGGISQTVIVGFNEYGKEISPLSPRLLSQLAAFAEPHLVTGPNAPEELVGLVKPNGELRLYFRSGTKSIRLTIRRNNDGGWALGTTLNDTHAADEMYFDPSTFQKYGPNETIEMESSLKRPPTNELPASWLRRDLRRIRGALASPAFDLPRFQNTLKAWRFVIPELPHNNEILSLLLIFSGVHFDLVGGFVNTPLTNFTDEQAQLLAAIKYLHDNQLVFLSSRARIDQTQPSLKGIYPRAEAPIPKQVYFTDVDLSEELTQLMRDRGLTYNTRNRQWED